MKKLTASSIGTGLATPSRTGPIGAAFKTATALSRLEIRYQVPNLRGETLPCIAQVMLVHREEPIPWHYPAIGLSNATRNQRLDHDYRLLGVPRILESFLLAIINSNVCFKFNLVVGNRKSQPSCIFVEPHHNRNTVPNGQTC